MTTTTHLERAAGGATRALSRRLSRRTFVGRVGRYAIATSLGAGGLALVDPAAAHNTGTCGACNPGAPTCCTNGTDSVLCSNLPGWNQNSCPPGTAGCGSWTAGTCGPGGTGTLRFADCCLQCGNGDLCTCIGGAPSCCRHQRWRNGAIDDCAINHIKCRRSFCS
jgi:hypothetical protein